MLNTIKNVLGYLWAAPITLFGLSYVGICQLMGWYRYIGVRDLALVWATVPEKMPKWFKALWGGNFNLHGQAIGNVIVIDIQDVNPDDVGNKSYKRLMTHEMAHVKQVMRLGIFQPLLYGVNYLVALALDDAHPYYDNLFEIDARRAADQTIDMFGLQRRFKELEEKKSQEDEAE